MDHPMEAHKVDSRHLFARRLADVKEVVSFLEKRPAKFRRKFERHAPYSRVAAAQYSEASRQPRRVRVRGTALLRFAL